MRLTRTPGPIGPAELAPSSAAATGREHAPRFTVAAGRSRRSPGCAEYRPGRLQFERQHAGDFLGLGPPPPAATLGLMVSEGTNIAGIAWWSLAFPAVAVVLLVLGFTLTGDGLRDALDPGTSDS